jgi:thymidine phosphorylase
MLLKVKSLRLEAKRSIVIINKDDAAELDVKPLDRVELSSGRRRQVAIVNVAEKFVPRGTIGLYSRVQEDIRAKAGQQINVCPTEPPESLDYIKKRLDGNRLDPDEIRQIISDVVDERLSDIEITSFVISLYNHQMTMKEVAAMATSMAATGETLDLGRKRIYDKHSLTWETPTIIENNDKRKTIRIGKFIDGIINRSKSIIDVGKGAQYVETKGCGYNVIVFDKNNKILSRPLTGVFRHPSPKTIYEIKLKGNKCINVTRCHSLFLLRDGKIESVPTKDLKVGDFIAVPREIPETNKKIKKINFIDELMKLPEKDTEGIFITGIEHNYRKQDLGVQGDYGITAFNTYRKKNVKLPLNSEIRVKRGNNIPIEIEVNEDLLSLLGYWTAEGYTNKNGVHFSLGAHEKELIEEIVTLSKKVFGLKATITHPHKTAVHINIYNMLLSRIFSNVFKLKKGATMKNVPEIVFNVSKRLQKTFLKSYFKGDGYFRRNYEIIAVTSSNELYSDLQYLLTLCGMAYSISKKPAHKRTFPLGYESDIAPSYYIYTQNNPLNDNESNTAAYINFIPIRNGGLHKFGNSNLWNWETRRVFRRQNFITFDKMRGLATDISEDENDIRKIVFGDLGFLPVKEIKKIKTKNKYVYDFCVDGYENFIAGECPICVHNSIGGVPGDKTSMVLVPVVAAAGLTIPKTSSRAITAPAGTADRMECLCPVDLKLDEIKVVVRQTNGCLVWGGAVDLAPADDAFIGVEYPLSIDPLLLPSVMSKKKAVGARYVAIDIPTGKGVKVKTVAEAEDLANKFIELGKKLGMKVSCISSFGEQPIGYGVGPALEAREVLASVSNVHRMPKDLLEKVSRLGGELFEFAHKKNPDSIAYDMLKSGRAEKKLREIIAAQGGDPNIKPTDIPIGPKRVTIKATKPGKVWWINNAAVTAVARMAGAPKDKGAGMLMHKKIGDTVKRGEPLLEIYAEKTTKLNCAMRMGEKTDLMAVGKKFSMVMAEIPKERRHKNSFILER